MIHPIRSYWSSQTDGTVIYSKRFVSCPTGTILARFTSVVEMLSVISLVWNANQQSAEHQQYKLFAYSFRTDSFDFYFFPYTNLLYFKRQTFVWWHSITIESPNQSPMNYGHLSLSHTLPRFEYVLVIHSASRILPFFIPNNLRVIWKVYKVWLVTWFIRCDKFIIYPGTCMIPFE